MSSSISDKYSIPLLIVQYYSSPEESDIGALFALHDLLASTVVPKPIDVRISGITPEIIEQCQKLALANMEKLEKRENDKELHFFAGKHCTVFSHTELPGLVLKIMVKKQAEDSKRDLDIARKAFAQRGFQYCHAPQAELADLGNDETLFIMERAKGETDELLAQELMEQEFERIASEPKMAEKWKTMTREVAEATALIGYWDSQRKNLIWDSEKGWTFVDFERVKPTRSNIQTGLSRLAEIFPPQFVGEIYDVVDGEGITLDITRDAAKVKRQAQFELSRSCSRRNKEKGLPRVLEEDKWDEASWERRILDKFDENRTQPWYVNYKPAQTQLFWQPFSMSGAMRETPEIYYAQHAKERAGLEAALERMQKAGDVLTWRIMENPNQKELVAYTIYF